MAQHRFSTYYRRDSRKSKIVSSMANPIPGGTAIISSGRIIIIPSMTTTVTSCTVTISSRAITAILQPYRLSHV